MRKTPKVVSQMTVIKADGAIETSTRKAPALEEAQKIVGGYVQMLKLDGKQMLVDEDGLSKNLKPNHRASEIAHTYIVGTAIVLSGKARWK